MIELFEEEVEYYCQSAVSLEREHSHFIWAEVGDKVGFGVVYKSMCHVFGMCECPTHVPIFYIVKFHLQ